MINLYALVELWLGIRKMRSLRGIMLFEQEVRPKVSIIVPACNEEKTIEPALLSILNMDYNPVEIIVVNDRSTDGTGEILAQIKQEYPELLIHTIEELPEGWLGKNHALHQGVLQAQGEFVLFTDADILFEKTTLSRAMSIMINEQIDHLSLIFRNIARGLLLNAMMVDAGGGLFFLFKPWKVSDPKSKNFIGVGAFNLVRKSVYIEIGGHEQIRMHPIDDIMLGKIIKRNGFRQECLSGYDFLAVHWYDSPVHMINGLMKNIFALYNFRVSYVMIAVLMICLLTILPLWGVFLTSGMTQLVCFLTVFIRLLSSAYGANITGTTYWTLPLALVTPYINIYIILKGILVTLTNDGIDWRGTHYPLNKLKENMPIL